MKSILASIKKKMDFLIEDPQLSRIELMRKQVAFYWTIGSFFSIIALTLLAYFLQAKIIGHFGVVLLIFYAIMIPLFRKHNYEFYQTIFLAAIISTAFIFMLIFGGYTNSAGLVFVGLICVMSSILSKSIRTAYLLFFLYVCTILGLAILNPYLTPHPDVTREINFAFFIINTIWMSAAMMFFIIQYLNERNKFQLAETNRLQELDDAKAKLFTSITHEFRTPITLISGMADEIRTRDAQATHAVKQIQKQSKKLLNLVNQILDLAKIDANTIKTHVIQGNIINFLKYIFESFHSAADSKGIQFQIESDIDDLWMDYDPEKLESIVITLISNAIKFTPEGGSVKVFVNQYKGDFLEISFKDTGCGIPSDEIENIFHRFYQVKRDKFQEGNGIGLTIVKEFLNLMHGHIEVSSELGQGSMFKITLPINRMAPKEISDFEDKKPLTERIPNSGMDSDAQEIPLLLIIDDHQDIVDYLKILLKDQYRIIIAQNGKKGFDLAIQQVPDVIISDIMMPKMDGFEFLKKIKSEFRTSHIPVLMLTARADRLSKLEGLELGAEAYLLKPFDKKELYIRLRKLLDLRKTLYQRFRHIFLSRSDQKKSGDIEDQFMNKFHQVIDDHLDDESFDIKQLCLELGMSHTQLYRKFSALTELTVNKYIRKYRLHRAMSLMKSKELNISQIALEVGFPNLAYFSRIFTEEFGINPSKVKKSKYIVERDTE